MAIHFHILGVLLIILAVSHVFFPKYFQWKEILGSLNVMTRQMFYVHSFFIALSVCMMGLLCLMFDDELINTPLGKHICLGLGIFWGIRLVVQLFVYSPTLWRGKKFETSVHILFSIFWTYLTVVFIAAFLR